MTMFSTPADYAATYNLPPGPELGLMPEDGIMEQATGFSLGSDPAVVWSLLGLGAGAIFMLLLGLLYRQLFQKEQIDSTIYYLEVSTTDSEGSSAPSESARKGGAKDRWSKWAIAGLMAMTLITMSCAAIYLAREIAFVKQYQRNERSVELLGGGEGEMVFPGVARFKRSEDLATQAPPAPRKPPVCRPIHGIHLGYFTDLPIYRNRVLNSFFVFLKVGVDGQIVMYKEGKTSPTDLRKVLTDITNPLFHRNVYRLFCASSRFETFKDVLYEFRIFPNPPSLDD